MKKDRRDALFSEITVRLTLIGLACCLAGCSRSSERDVVTLKKLRLVDADGHVRAVLGTEGKTTVLEIMNEQGVQASLKVNEEGSRLSLGLMTNQVPQIDIAVSEGIPRIQITDTNSIVRLFLSANSESSSLGVRSPSEHGSGALLSALKDGDSFLQLFDSQSKPAVGVGTSKGMEVVVFDENEMPRSIVPENKANHGLESTGAPPAAGTPETHP